MQFIETDINDPLEFDGVTASTDEAPKATLDAQPRKRKLKKVKALKTRTRVCAWRNKAEFETVYNNIFGPEATRETQASALESLRAWKRRRNNETPPAIVSTLALLEVMQKDTGDESDQMLASIYSNALTRFLNFVTTIETKGKKKRESMYSIAKKLGIDSFIVDLRHLCAHRANMPSLDMFRGSTRYCMNWVKEFYWERTLETIEDTDYAHMQENKVVLGYLRRIKRMYTVYDVVTEAIHKGAEDKDEIHTAVTDAKRLEVTVEYLSNVKHSSLERILRRVVADLINAAKSKVIYETYYYFTRELLNCPYFVEATIKAYEDRIPVVQLHQKLLFEFMRNGYIDHFIFRCVYIMEDRFEPPELRKCAAIWFDKMLEGIELMKEIGPIDREEYTTVEELERIEKGAYVKLLELAKERGVNPNKTVVLHNFILHPVTIDIDAEFLEDRFENSDFVSAIYAERLLNFVQDMEKRMKYRKLVDFIMIFKEDDDEGKKSGGSAYKETKIFTAEDDLTPLLTPEQLQKIHDRHQFGDWRIADEYDWKRIPLGYVFGENEAMDNEFRMK